MLRSRAAGIALGVLADALRGDPNRHHPVAWFGSFAAKVEEQTYADNVNQGAAHVLATLAPVAALGIVAERTGRKHPVLHAGLTALATWAALGARSLAHEGTMLADKLDAGDLARAREQLPNLCGRDASQLDESELARAAVESMAENTADAAVASLFWGAALGIPGLLLHRATNTLDAMIGHKNPRYARFGMAAAKLDDALDYVPARFTGTLACGLAPLVGGSAKDALTVMLRDARNHPSPNGGWCESAWAGALGVQLGGRNIYANRIEDRPLLGDGPRPGASALRKASRLVIAVTAAATSVGVLALCVLGKARR